MSSAVLEEEIRPALTDTDNEDFYDEYKDELILLLSRTGTHSDLF